MIELRDGVGRVVFTGSVEDARRFELSIKIRETPKKAPPPPRYYKVCCPHCKGKNLSTGLFNNTLRECYLCPKDGYFLIANKEHISYKTRFFLYASLLRLLRGRVK